MNRPPHRQVLECASPLALWKSWVVESARGLAHSKTLPRFILSQSDTTVQGFKARILFRRILTPALSRWERENRRPLVGVTWVGVGRTGVGKISTRDGCSL